MKNKNTMPLHIGGASILAVFVLVLLASFGGLAVSSANADMAFAKRNEENIKEYYALDAAAQDKLAGDWQDEISFEEKGQLQSIAVSAVRENGKIVIEEYRSVPMIPEGYGENSADLWDGETEGK